METGLGDPETNKARYLIQQLEEETNPQLRRVIQKQINELSTGTTDRIIISNVVQNLNNPLCRIYLKTLFLLQYLNLPRHIFDI